MRSRKAILGLVALAAVSAIVLPAHSATPGRGRLSSKPVTWTGGPLNGHSGTASCVAGVNCDDFLLDIDLPALLYRSAIRPVVDIVVAAQDPNDVDLAIFPPGADTRATSNDSQVVDRQADLESPKKGEWRIRTLCNVCANAIYSVTARLLPPLPLPKVGPSYGLVTELPKADSGTEPRVVVDSHGTRWAISNSNGTAAVYSSHDGGKTWKRTATDPAGQIAPTIDVDIAVTHTGRLIASELDFAGINFPTSYSDDDGATWTESTGTKLADMDRQWLAVGPDDPGTHQPRVYLLYHNLFTGTVTHNMWVMTSTDGGATFGPPVPTTLPGSPAWLDLQCSDSGGPSTLSVDPKTGRLYAVFGTRSSAAGGCGAQPFEVNIVAATRVWVVTSPDNSPGSWTQSLAVDDSDSGRIVGMQLAYGGLDKAGNLWIAYPESPHPYPDYSGAAIRVRWAPPDLSKWSDPITMDAGGGAGNLLPHLVAGDPGKIDVAYFHGIETPSGRPAWYLEVAQSLDAMSAHPHVTREIAGAVPAYVWTASEMMGACASGPAGGIESGLDCNRSTDVWGVALDGRGMLTVVWPTVKNSAPRNQPGTFVSTQTSGRGLYSAVAPRTPSGKPPTVLGKHTTRRTLASTGTESSWPAVVLLLVAVALAVRLRRRVV